MNHSQHGEYSLPDSAYNSAMLANVSSYFVPPNKVVKPNSRNSSPRTLGRRKTTTSATFSSRTRSVVDSLRTSAQQCQNPESKRSRPTSWHPNSVEATNLLFDPSINVQDLTAWNFSTAQVNGLITPLSYPSMNEPQIQELFTPLDGVPGQDMPFPYENQLYHERSWLSLDQTKPDQYSFPIYLEQPLVQPCWQFNHPTMAPTVQTAPSSPDCPPVQNMGLDTLSLDNGCSGSKDDAEELVGMGLYDSPAEVQSSSLLFNGFSRSGRKVLKLEESFEPEECEEEEDEEEYEEEGGDYTQAQESVNDEGTSSEAFNNSSYNADYDSQSIASHLTFGMRPDADSIASKYLATLRQLNSAYYPTGHAGYGWI